MSRKKVGAYKRVLGGVKIQPLSIRVDAGGNFVIAYSDGILEFVPVVDGQIAVGYLSTVKTDVFRRAIERKIQKGKGR